MAFGVAITMGLALLLAVGFPALIIASRGRAVRIGEWYTCVILILSVMSLYVSSLCSTAIRALLLSVLATPFVMLVLGQPNLRLPHFSMLTAVMLSAFLALVLWFGLENHRSAERGAWRIGGQVVVMAGCLAFSRVLLAVIG